MAKTFNPNRVGGGTISIVRAADGTYSLKETGFDQISSLNMIDLGAVATTTTAAKTETAAEKTGTTTADQTKAAFLLPSGDKEDPFTFEKTLKSAGDVSKSLQDVSTPTTIQDSMIRTNRFDADTFDDAVGTRVKDPTEAVFGRSTPSQEQFERQATLPETKVETPQEKLKVTSSNVQKGLVEPPGFDFSFLGGSKFKTEKGTSVNVDKGRGSPLGERYRSEVAQAGTIPPDAIVQGQPALGISADPSKTMAMKQAELDSGAITPRVPDAIIQGQPSVPAKKTFIQSATTALKNVGDTAMKLASMSPTLSLISTAAIPVNESASTTAFNKNRFNVVTSSGSMQGRIVGDDGSYDPANNLFHGMNRSSKLGNLEKAGQKRIDNINKTLSKKNLNARTREVLTKRRDDFERELDGYRRDKNNHNIKSAQKKGVDTSKLNPNEMRNVAQTGNVQGNTNDGGGGNGGGKSIVCTAMYQTTGLQDSAKAMKIWYIYQKRYLTIQHQEGYHKLFKPFVKGMHKSNIIKAIGAHFGKHRTQHLKHVLFKSKPSLLGKVYSKILETICYWAGKK